MNPNAQNGKWGGKALKWSTWRERNVAPNMGVYFSWVCTFQVFSILPSY